MTKEELFKKYSIDESHNVWESIDSWMSVEIYRIMHNGNLPPKDDKSIKWVLDFLYKCRTDTGWLFGQQNYVSSYLTAKRMVYRFSEQILQEVSLA